MWLSLVFKELDHRLAHAKSYVHVGLGATAVMAAGATGRDGQRVGVNAGHGAFVLRVLRSIRDVHDRFKDLTAPVVDTLLVFSECGGDELGVWCIEVLAQRIDQESQVLLVAVEVGGIVAVLAALPPEETGNSVLRRAGVVGIEFCEDFLGVGGVVVVLLAGVPLDAFRLSALVPLLGRLLIARVDHGPDFAGLVVLFFDFPGRAAGWQEVPAQAAVADGATDNQHGTIKVVAQLVADTLIHADGLALDCQPVVALHFHAALGLHHVRHTDVLAFGPFAGVVDHERVQAVVLDRTDKRLVSVLLVLRKPLFMLFFGLGLLLLIHPFLDLEDGLLLFDSAVLKRVGLTHDDEDLDGLGHVCGLAIGVGQLVIDRVLGKRGACEQAQAQQRGGESGFLQHGFLIRSGYRLEFGERPEFGRRLGFGRRRRSGWLAPAKPLVSVKTLGTAKDGALGTARDGVRGRSVTESGG